MTSINTNSQLALAENTTNSKLNTNCTVLYCDIILGQYYMRLNVCMSFIVKARKFVIRCKA